MLFKKRNAPSRAHAKSFDPECKVPVLRCSICTGEQVAGFKDTQTGAFEDVALIRTPADLTAFMQEYGITTITKEY